MEVIYALKPQKREFGQNKNRHLDIYPNDGLLEQGTGVEPALTAWEAAVIPIYQPCIVTTEPIVADSL